MGTFKRRSIQATIWHFLCLQIYNFWSNCVGFSFFLRSVSVPPIFSYSQGAPKIQGEIFGTLLMLLRSCYFIFQSTFSPLFRLNNFYGPNSRFPGSLPSPSSGSVAYLLRFPSAYSTTPFPEDTTSSLYFLRVLGFSVHSCSSWLMVAHRSFSKMAL